MPFLWVSHLLEEISNNATVPSSPRLCHIRSITAEFSSFAGYFPLPLPVFDQYDEYEGGACRAGCLGDKLQELGESLARKLVRHDRGLNFLLESKSFLSEWESE